MLKVCLSFGIFVLVIAVEVLLKYAVSVIVNIAWINIFVLIINIGNIKIAI